MAHVRGEYQAAPLSPSQLDADPVSQFERWWRDAVRAGLIYPNAMTLATVDARGRAAARIVLLKGFDRRGFVFATNYESQKARQLAIHPSAALVLYWQPLDRQVRITGMVAKASKAESDAIFEARPRGAQIAAWASPQSGIVTDREELDARVREFQRKFRGRRVPRPAFWGVYRLKPDAYEFWQGRLNRLHDRFRYTRRSSSAWRIERLAP
ncbi:MAG: pyridoxamine 5'-phosphate oxidase [Phycisphaerae bacterium]